NIGTTASLAVTPTVSGTSGVVNYTVNGTDGASGCKATSAVVTISVAACTSIADNTGFGTTVKVYPAPANNGQLTISGLAGSTYITLSNILGQVVSQTLSDKMEETLDVSKLSSGQYMVTVSDGANQSRSFKVLIQN
ncbi:MAG: T9SS type A sorting domain-containing protein, partial [Bacteroidia bacterium]